MRPTLVSMNQLLNCGDLSETWCVPDIGAVSHRKILYDYQADCVTLEDDSTKNPT